MSRVFHAQVKDFLISLQDWHNHEQRINRGGLSEDMLIGMLSLYERVKDLDPANRYVILVKTIRPPEPVLADDPKILDLLFYGGIANDVHLASAHLFDTEEVAKVIAGIRAAKDTEIITLGEAQKRVALLPPPGPGYVPSTDYAA